MSLLTTLGRPVADVSSSCAADWFSRVKESVGKGYVVVASDSLWEIRNIVFVKEELAGFVRNIYVSGKKEAEKEKRIKELRRRKKKEMLEEKSERKRCSERD